MDKIKLLLLLSLCITQLSYAEVDLNIIAIIESSNNPSAYNERTHATGLYQITPICLKDLHQNFARGFRSMEKDIYDSIMIFDIAHFSMEDMFHPDLCYIVADWYMNYRIPQMLKHYGFKDTTDARLACYNAGIGVYKGYKEGKRKLPNQTINYIKKYHKLRRQNETMQKLFNRKHRVQ